MIINQKKLRTITLIMAISFVSTLTWSLPTVMAASGTAAAPVPSSSDYAVLAPLPCISSAPSVDANGQPVPGITCPGGNLENQNTVSFKTYVQYMMNLLIALAAVAAVFMIVWGGIEYMTTTSFTTKKASLDRVTHAVYGLILVLASYLILRTIDPRLVAIPSTFVPKLTLRSDLTKNTSMTLLQQVQAQADQYKITSTELAQEVQKAKDNMAATQKKLDAVNSELGELLYNQGLSENDPQVLQKKAEKQRLTDQLNVDSNNVTMTASKVFFNGHIGSALNEVSTASSPQEAIKQIQTDIANQKTDRDNYGSKLISNGQYDLEAFNNEANYAEYRMKLIIAEQMTESITQISSGSYGEAKYTVSSPDGTSLQSFGTLNGARTYVQTELSKLSVSANNISDQALKDDLKSKIEQAQLNLNTKIK